MNSLNDVIAFLRDQQKVWLREALEGNARYFRIAAETLEKLRGVFQPWDENNPPPPGTYVVYHSRFRHPGEQVWTFRAANNGKFFGEDKVRWSYKKGQCAWFNEGNWQADGAPEWYCPLPRFPREQDATPTLAGKEG